MIVVGAGIAGLHAASLLKTWGASVRIFETSKRVGGRIWTDRKTFSSSGMTWEIGGELIDSNHETIMGLCRSKNLELVDLKNAENAGLTDTYFFKKKKYSERDLVKILKPAAKAMKEDLAKVGDIKKPYTMSGALAELDRLSIDQWLSSRKIGSDAVAILRVAFCTELGLDTSELSCVPMLQMFAGNADEKEIRIFGESDERFWIKGGNDALCQALASDLKNELELETHVEHIQIQPTGVTLSIRQNNQSREVKAQRCILTAPFSALRQGVLEGVPLSEAKKRAIQGLELGTNSKIGIGVSKKFWTDEKATGEIFTDLSFQSCWDSSRGQSGTGGILTNFRGGSAGKAVSASQASELAKEVLQGLQSIFTRNTQLSSLAIADVSVGDWPRRPSGGSYSTYKVGQMTSFGGAEREAEGFLHFAGEHTSEDFQGFMEGAAESGLRAAKEVASALSLKTP